MEPGAPSAAVPPPEGSGRAGGHAPTFRSGFPSLSLSSLSNLMSSFSISFAVSSFLKFMIASNTYRPKESAEWLSEHPGTATGSSAESGPRRKQGCKDPQPHPTTATQLRPGSLPRVLREKSPRGADDPAPNLGLDAGQGVGHPSHRILPTRPSQGGQLPHRVAQRPGHKLVRVQRPRLAACSSPLLAATWRARSVQPHCSVPASRSWGGAGPKGSPGPPAPPTRSGPP